MKCTFSLERLKITELCLEQISKNYENVDGLIDIFMESFLVTSKSITDYVIMDYLETHFKTMEMSTRSKIIQNKISWKGEKQLKNKGYILDFLKKHNKKYEHFENIPLVAYFLTLRNILVHSMVPHIFENQYQGVGVNQKVISRRFQRDFQNYLLKNDGGGLLQNSGYHLLLNDSGKDSFFDIKPLSKIEDTEKPKLKKRLENEEPLELMNEYLEQLSIFIKKFET